MSNITTYLVSASLILLVIRQIREHPLDARSLAVPVLAVGAAAVMFLHSIPAGGSDLALEAAALAGAAMGAIGGLATRLRLGPGGRPLGRAGVLAAGMWIGGVGARLAFAVAGRNAVDALARADGRIVEINAAERLAVVQPGVVNDVLRAAAAEQGLWYPPDPASAPWSTIGGNVATNAGGLCCVKYGVTRDYVLALEVVTASGEVVRLGRRTAKGVAGYDLVGLMVGSEGTLGVITEVTVRLRPPRPAPSRTVVGFFDTLAAAGAAVAARHGGGLQPAEFELIDRPACAR